MSNVIRILSFDPGSQFTGYAILDYHIDTGNVHIVTMQTLSGDRLARQYKHTLLPIFGKPFTILDAYYNKFSAIINEYKPKYVISENAFSHLYVSAYASLILVIHTLRRATKDTLGIDVILYQPKEVKRAVTNSGSADKSDMKVSISKNENITAENKHELMEMATDHAIDAVGVGYTFIKLSLPSLI